MRAKTTSGGRVIEQSWRAQGPLGRLVRRVSYGYDLTVNGVRERKFGWSTREAALTALRERQQAAEAGLQPAPERTLIEVAAEYLKFKADANKRSIKEDARILKDRLMPAFGASLRVRQLAAPMIAQYAKRRAGEVSAFTVVNKLTVLRHMLNLARRWGYITQVPDFDLPKKPEGRMRYLDTDEIAKLLKACAVSRNPYLLAIITVALNTGMRKAEILGLEWDRIDLSTSRLTLYKTKSGKPRGVPINRAVYDALVALEPNAGARHGRVFKRRDGAAWGQVRTAFELALRRAGIKDFRFHDLRHTAASHLVMRGASLTDVKEILGHADMKTTLRYAHLSPPHLRTAVDRLDGLTESAFTAVKSAVSDANDLTGKPAIDSKVLESQTSPRSSGG